MTIRAIRCQKLLGEANFCGLNCGPVFVASGKSSSFSYLEEDESRPRSCESGKNRFYNNLRVRGDCLSTRKSCKTSTFVGWIVG